MHRCLELIWVMFVVRFELQRSNLSLEEEELNTAILQNAITDGMVSLSFAILAAASSAV